MLRYLLLALLLIPAPALAAPKPHVLAVRDDRIPDTKPSYVYAGRHKRYAVYADYKTCRAAGRALEKSDVITRFSCLRARPHR